MSDQHHEPALEPDMPIVDSHIHLWNVMGYDYFAEEYLEDIKASGHRVEASIYVENDMCRGEVRLGKQWPASESVFAIEQSRLSPPGGHQISAVIMGFAKLQDGDAIKRVLEDHIEVSEGRFHGIRWRGCWDADPDVRYDSIPDFPPTNVINDGSVLEGARCLARMGLTLAAWVLHPQLEDIGNLAAKVPDLPVTLNHTGGPIGLGHYASQRDEVFRNWSNSIRKIARVPNLHIQIGGFGASRLGYKTPGGRQLVSSDELASDWRPYVEICIEAFGPDRVIFGSNFSVDRRVASFGTYINAIKKMIAGCTPAEREQIMSGNARRFFRMT